MLKFDITSSVRAAAFGAAVVVASVAAVPAQAAGLVPVEEKRRCDLSGTMALTTDYVFRGISFSDEGPAIQGSVDLTCGIFYTGVWASSIDNQDGANPNAEIDVYAGITPSFKGFDFDFGVIGYTYPHVNADNDYVEIKAGVSKAVTDKVTLGVTYLHAFYDGAFGTEDSDTVEGSWSVSLPKVGIFSPSLSGVVGWEEQDPTGGGTAQDYVYWSVGLSGDFHERWTVDVRYWDTEGDLVDGNEHAEERVVGTISASF